MNPETHGPWGPRDMDADPPAKPPAVAPSGPPAEAVHRRRINWLRLRLGLIGGVVALIALLMNLFPGRVSTADDWGHLGRMVTVLLIVSAGAAGLRHLQPSQTLRYLAIWAVIIAVLVTGYVMRSELTDLGHRIVSAAVPEAANSNGPKEVVVGEAEDGAYYISAQVNGQTLTFLVDSGASDIVLSPADADRLGIDRSQLKFRNGYETANGKGSGAAWRVDELNVGAIRLRNVEVAINGAPMRTSLLGMTFFKRLKSFRFEGGRLILTAF